MTTGHLDTTKYNTLVANAAAKTVISSQIFKDFIADVKNKLESNYDEAAANYNQFMNRQALINGNFDVWNEGTSIDVATGRYTAEMWRENTAGAIYTVSKQAITDLPGSEYCARITYKTVGANDAYFTQGFETDVFNKFKGKKATVSFQARKNGTPANFKSWLAKTVSESNVHSGTIIGVLNDFASLVTSAWQKFSFTVDMPATTDTNNGLQLVFQAVMTNINEYIEIAQVQLCSSDTALPYQPKSKAEEEILTQRFYEKSYDIATAPGTASASAGLTSKVVPNNTIAVAQHYGTVNFRRSKRIAPTLTIYPFTTPSNSGRVSDINGIDLGASTGAPTYVGTNSFDVYNASGATATTVGSGVVFHWTADARL